MFSAEKMWNEFVFQTRLKYVAFQRLMWAFDTLIFIIAILVSVVAPLPSPWNAVLVGAALLRVLTSALNHNHVAQLHDVGDPWKVMYPFH